MLYRIILSIIFLMLSLPSYTSFSSDEEEEYVEEFVEFVLGKYKGSRFYAVVMNMDEEPYLNVEDIFNNWIEMPGQCDASQKQCQGSLAWSEEIFWIDLDGMRAGSNIESKEVLMLKKGDAILKDNKIWLKWSIFPKWLPVNTNWTKYRYALSMTTNYLPLEARKKKRAYLRTVYHEAKNKKELIDKEPVKYAKEEYANELKLGSSLQKNQETTQYYYINAVSDLFQGTLLFNSSIDKLTVTPAIDSYHYENYRIPKLFRFESGNIHSFGGAIVPPFKLKNGLKIQTHEEVVGGGRFEYSDNVQPDTEVDIFKNGFILSSTVIDQSGQLILDEQHASGGDLFRFRYYYPDGNESTKNIIIAPDKAKLLDKGEAKHNIAMGQQDTGYFFQQSLRVGISKIFSTGAQVYLTSHGEKRSKIGLDFTLRLSDHLNFQYDQLFMNDLSLYSASARYNGWSNQLWDINFTSSTKGKINKGNPFIRDSIQNNKLQVRHWASTHGWYFFSSLENVDNRTTLYQEFNRRLGKHFSTKGTANYFKSPGKKSRYLSEFIFSANFGRHKFQLDLDLNHFKVRSNLQMRFPSVPESAWNLKLDLSIDQESNIHKGIAGSLRIADGISCGASFDGENYALTVRVADTVSTLKKDLRVAHFSTGRLYGRMLTPPNEEGEISPIEDVKIRAGSRVGISNSDGYYVIDGLAVNQKLLVEIDKNTLDLSYTLSKSFHIINLRPGSQIKLNPNIVHSVGIDGVFLTYENIDLNAKIAVVNPVTNIAIAETILESDGFFLIEQLSPGDYWLKLSGVKYAPENVKITIPAGKDWVSGIEIAATNYKPKSA